MHPLFLGILPNFHLVSWENVASHLEQLQALVWLEMFYIPSQTIFCEEKHLWTVTSLIKWTALMCNSHNGKPNMFS